MKPLHLSIAFLIFFFIVRFIPLYGQQITFNKVVPPDGKTFKHITGITQDANGFIWLATKKGLYIHDGYQMIHYQNNPLDPNSLASDHLETICTDTSGMIWIGTVDAGLDRFDPVSLTFKHYRHNPQNEGSLNADYVSVVMVDHEGILWVGSGEGLDRYDTKTDKFTHFVNKPGDSTSLSCNDVRAIYEDRQGTLWIGTGSPYAGSDVGPEVGGLNRMNKKTGTFIRYKHDPEKSNSLINNKVRAIYEDSRSTFWIGTAGDGLHIMDRTTGTFTRLTYDPSHPEKLSRPPLDKTFQTDHITFITEDVTGVIWIGTSESGINCFNPKTGKTTQYGSYKGTSDAFSRNVWWAFSSREGILWISTLSGELYRIDPLRKTIPYYETSSGYVNSFYEEPDGTLWIGTSHGIIRKEKEGKISNQLQINPGTSSTENNSTNIIKKDSQGNIWIGGDNGLTQWDKDNNESLNFKHKAFSKYSLSNNSVYTIYEDKDANLWVGTNRGLNLLNRNSDSFSQYLIDPNDTTKTGRNFISAILQDKRGKLWVGSYFGGGLNQFDVEHKKFTNYVDGIFVHCLYEDSNGILWMGCDDGLYKYDNAAVKFVQYNDLKTFTGISEVFSIVEDNQKYLWLRTPAGILRLNPQRNEINIYSKNYGINENSWTSNSAYKGRHGELYFGDANGYYSFNPAELARSIKPPKIVITRFRLGDQIIKPEKDGLLKESLAHLNEIVLSFNQNIFSFDFTAIDFTSVDYKHPDGNQLLCMLENYDKNWYPANSDRKAYYFNIPPGNYIFRVKAANSYGVWAEKKINIIILPPWWRTWWAYGFYALLLIAAVFGFDRIMRRRIVMAEQQRSRTRELAQAKEIEKAYTELKATQSQLIQSEKMASLGELTAGIAHEIQNPLNFVNNFSEINKELIEEMKTEIEKGNFKEVNALAVDIASNEEKINHHGKRADAIVKGMLQHSRSSSGVKEPTDINALADEYLRLAYHGLRAKDKTFNATMNSDFDKSIGKINVIPQDIGRVILNLITNAFYAVNEKKKMNIPGYEPMVSVSTSHSPGEVLIKVKDNGNGIPQKNLDKIYQPFFTTKPSGQGTGLGLSMSYEIITKAHGGELKVETKEGEGTEFTIILPG